MRVPHRDTPLTVRAAFLFLISSIAVVSAEAKDLSDLFAAMDSQSVVIAQARTELADVQRQYQASRAIPNPSLGFDHERIEVNDVTEKETVYSITQPLGFLWTYGASRAGAKHALESAAARYEETRKDTYVQAVAAALDVKATAKQMTYADTVLNRTRGLVNAMQKRLEFGDVSEFELNRLQAELLLTEQERQELLSEYQNAARLFTQVSGLPVSWCEMLSLTESLDVPFTSEDDAVSHALNNRAILKQALANEASAVSYHSTAKRNRLPDISASIGRKTVAPSFDGMVVGAEIEVPIFSQRRSDVQFTRARLYESKLQSSAAATRVEQETRQAYRIWQSSRDRRLETSSGEQSILANLDRGLSMYAQGELSAMELVDVLRSGSDVLAARNSFDNLRLLSALELRRITGLSLEGGQ